MFVSCDQETMSLSIFTNYSDTRGRVTRSIEWLCLSVIQYVTIRRHRQVGFYFKGKQYPLGRLFPHDDSRTGSTKPHKEICLFRRPSTQVPIKCRPHHRFSQLLEGDASLGTFDKSTRRINRTNGMHLLTLLKMIPLNHNVRTMRRTLWMTTRQ